MVDLLDDSNLPEPSLKNIIDQKSLKWVFVGGKGGVGKTTTSCCLGAQLAQSRNKVLIVSTDPAHNLSDAFCQKVGREPTPIRGFDNLSAMEIDANDDMEKMQQAVVEAGASSPDDDSGLNNLMAELTSSIPGIDEAMSFSELMKQVQNMDYDVVVFDTARTFYFILYVYEHVCMNVCGCVCVFVNASISFYSSLFFFPLKYIFYSDSFYSYWTYTSPSFLSNYT